MKAMRRRFPCSGVHIVLKSFSPTTVVFLALAAPVLGFVLIWASFQL